jgi:O-antigen/teichoic acid export membrane protein
LGYAVFPVWLFQGIEELRLAALLMVVSRFVSMLLLFVFVKGPQDVVMAALLVALPTLAAGIVSWPLLINRLGGRPFWVGIRHVHRYLQIEFEVFISRVSQSFFTAAAPVALGFVSTQHQVAYFSLTDKIQTASLNSYLPISQAVYPRLCNLYRRDLPQAALLLRKAALSMIGIAAVATFGLVCLAKYIIWFVAGSAYMDAWPVMAALGGLPLIKAISNVLGMQMLAPLGYERIVARILWLAGLGNVCALVPVCWYSGAFGAALLVVGTELLVVVMLAVLLMRYRLLQRLSIGIA